MRLSAGLTRLFCCESAKVANNFVEIGSESTFQLSSNRLALSCDEEQEECINTPKTTRGIGEGSDGARDLGKLCKAAS